MSVAEMEAPELWDCIHTETIQAAVQALMCIVPVQV